MKNQDSDNIKTFRILMDKENISMADKMIIFRDMEKALELNLFTDTEIKETIQKYIMIQIISKLIEMKKTP
jgi:hypothetical protein